MYGSTESRGLINSRKYSGRDDILSQRLAFSKFPIYFGLIFTFFGIILLTTLKQSTTNNYTIAPSYVFTSIKNLINSEENSDTKIGSLLRTTSTINSGPSGATNSIVSSSITSSSTTPATATTTDSSVTSSISTSTTSITDSSVSATIASGTTTTSTSDSTIFTTPQVTTTGTTSTTTTSADLTSTTSTTSTTPATTVTSTSTDTSLSLPTNSITTSTTTTSSTEPASTTTTDPSTTTTTTTTDPVTTTTTTSDISTEPTTTTTSTTILTTTSEPVLTTSTSTVSSTDPTTTTTTISSTDPTSTTTSTSVSSSTTSTTTNVNNNNIPSVTNNNQFGASPSIDFTFARDGYGAIDLHHDFLKYTRISDYDAVLEPFVPMYMIVTNAATTSYYKYSACRTDPTTEQFTCYSGTLSSDLSQSVPIILDCEAFDELPLSIVEYDTTTNQALNTASGTAVCMYVRREIRSLTDADLSSTMDAMHTMWAISESEGKEIYGDNYHDAKYLVQFHHFNAAWQEADHIHEGNGFLTQHIKMTNILELSMQSVDPTVTLPYWDFTIDSAANLPVSESIIMTPNMFGSMSTPTNSRFGFTYTDDMVVMGGIPDGRWAFIKADVNDLYPDLKYAYGYMRAPWNMNPSPYVSRFTANMMIGTMLPTCASHYTILEEKDLMDFFYNMEDDPHATTHGLAGGTFGCDLFLPLLEDGYINDEDSLLAICSSWVFYLKEFYRSNYIIPNANCEVGMNPDEASCGFTCFDDSVEDLKFSLANKVSGYVPSEMSEDGWTAWTDFICTGDGQRVFSGDHLESASPSDPSFWPIHTTLERLTHAKLMAGGFQLNEWATDTKNDFVCVKSTCFQAEKGMFGDYDDCCSGHYQYDQLMDAVSGNKSNGFGPTNDFIFKSTDPTSDDYSMPYIYDSFTWDHCQEDFPGLLASLWNQANERRRK